MAMIDLTMDNLVYSLQKVGGASTYWSKLLEAFDGDPDIALTVVERDDALSNLERQKVEIQSPIVPSRFGNLRLDEISSLRQGGQGVFHSSYFRYATSPGKRNVTTIHDFIAARYFSGFVRLFSLWQMRRAILNSSGIICISESTKRDMRSIVPESADIPTKVIYHGVNSDDFFLPEDDKRPEVQDQAVFIGNRGVSYKNFELAVDSVAFNGSVKLKIVGAPLTDGERALLDSRLSGRYEVVEYPSSREIGEVFSRSLCVLYLSEYEGFGMPVLEAMSSGAPVIAMNKSSIPEVAGTAGILLESSSCEVVSRAIDSLRRDPRRFEECRAHGLAQASKFTWDRCIAQTKDFYAEVCEL